MIMTTCTTKSIRENRAKLPLREKNFIVKTKLRAKQEIDLQKQNND
jgi:hypothetical protein